MLIQDVLDVPELALRRLVGTDDQLGRTVRWAFATDLPDPSRYIVGGELVVTGMVWRRAPEDSDAFVASVVAAGAVALAAGDEVFGSVPDDVVNACEKYSLPLLAVPSAVAFADVIDAVTSRVTGDRVARLSASLARQHRLLTAVTDGRALADLTHETARDTGVTCRIITAVGRPVVSAEPLATEVVDALVRTAAQTTSAWTRRFSMRSVSWRASRPSIACAWTTARGCCAPWPTARPNSSSTDPESRRWNASDRSAST